MFLSNARWPIIPDGSPSNNVHLLERRSCRNSFVQSSPAVRETVTNRESRQARLTRRGERGPDETHLSAGRLQSFRDVVDRCLLGFADLLAVFPVSGCDFVGQRDDEAAIFFDLFRRGLPLKQSDGIT